MSNTELHFFNNHSGQFGDELLVVNLFITLKHKVQFFSLLLSHTHKGWSIRAGDQSEGSSRYEFCRTHYLQFLQSHSAALPIDKFQFSQSLKDLVFNLCTQHIQSNMQADVSTLTRAAVRSEIDLLFSSTQFMTMIEEHCSQLERERLSVIIEDTGGIKKQTRL